MYILIACLVLIAFVTLAILLIRRYAPKFDKGKPLKGILGVILFIALISAAPKAIRPVFHFLFSQQLNHLQQEKAAQNIEAMFQEVPFLKELQTYYPQEAEELKERLGQTWAKMEKPDDFKEAQAQVQALAGQELERILGSKMERASNRSVGEFALEVFSLMKKKAETDPHAADGLFDLDFSKAHFFGPDDDLDEMMGVLTKIGGVIKSSALTPQPLPTPEEVEAASVKVFKDIDRLVEKYDASLLVLMAGLEKPSIYKDLDPDLVTRFKLDLLDLFANGPVEEVGLMVRGNIGK